MPEYRPDRPYVIQSGKRKGKSLEQLMFHDYPFLKWWIGYMNEKERGTKNRPHQHLEWLLEQGENRKAQMLCPQCGQSPVRYFSSLGEDRFGYSIYPVFTCCERILCKEKLTGQAAGSIPDLYPIKFSSIIYYDKKFDQDMVVRLLRAVYNLPKRLTVQIAFEFFSK